MIFLISLHYIQRKPDMLIFTHLNFQEPAKYCELNSQQWKSPNIYQSSETWEMECQGKSDDKSHYCR